MCSERELEQIKDIFLSWKKPLEYLIFAKWQIGYFLDDDFT